MPCQKMLPSPPFWQLCRRAFTDQEHRTHRCCCRKARQATQAASFSLRFWACTMLTLLGNFSVSLVLYDYP